MTNEEIIKRIRSNDNVKQNMEVLYKNNTGLIHKYMKPYLAYAEADDLMQEGYLALADAVEHYNESLGMFSTYFMIWLKQKYSSYVDYLSPHSRTKLGLIRAYNSFVSNYFLATGKEPTNSQCCACLYLDIKQLEEIKQDIENTYQYGIDDVVKGTDGLTWAEMIQDKKDHIQEVEQSIDEMKLKTVLWGSVDELPDKQKNLVYLKYKNELSTKEISNIMNMANDEVYREHKNAIKRLKEPENVDKIKMYIINDTILSGATHGTSITTFRRTRTSATERTAIKSLMMKERIKNTV